MQDNRELLDKIAAYLLKKETITGSISTITTKDLKQSPTANINNALAGRMPGLLVNQFNGGEPGNDAAQLNIRGKSTYGKSDAS